MQNNKLKANALDLLNQQKAVFAIVEPFLSDDSERAKQALGVALIELQEDIIRNHWDAYAGSKLEELLVANFKRLGGE